MHVLLIMILNTLLFAVAADGWRGHLVTWVAILCLVVLIYLAGFVRGASDD